MKPIRVVVDARIPAQGMGGVQQVAIGLAAGLTAIAAPDLEVIYSCYSDAGDWLMPHAGSVDRLRSVPAPRPAPSAKARVAEMLPGLRRAYHAVAPVPPVPRSDGFLESLQPDIVHFPHQGAFLTEVPSVFQPHDLQHLHLPQFFTKQEIGMRETCFRAFCAQASLVAMGSTWGRDDILRHYLLPPEKVAVVPLAPVVEHYAELSTEELAQARAEMGLPAHYCFYPAQTWPHKNHDRLLHAVAKLKREGLVVPLVFSGAPTAHRAQLVRLIRKLGLAGDVTWVGFVSAARVRALYRMARCVVMPSLFESASQPVFEALASGVAVACSDVTATPRLAGDAAIIFDPLSVDDIANAIKRLWTDDSLRAELVARGRQRVSGFTWERTARHFAAYYRRIAGRELDAADRELLAATPDL